MSIPFKIFGLQLVFSSAEKGLWYDSDKDVDHLQEGFGVVFKIRGGWVIRPYTRIKYILRDVPSKWNQFNPKYHGVIKFWFPVLPYFSIAILQYGFYIGFKAFNLHKDKYAPLVGAENIRPGNQALTSSLTLRQTRWK